MPFFSVVIPLYNKAATVESTLHTLVAQTYGDFEAIVVDDGSRDRGAEIVIELSDPRIRLIRQENAGVSVARNCGISEACGEWVVFLDADDRWHPDLLRSFFSAIVKYPDVEACFCAYHVVTDDMVSVAGFVDDSETEIIVEDYFRFELETGASMWTSATAVRRPVFDHTGTFPVGVKMGEDLDMWMRLALCVPKMAYIPQALASYDMRGAGACQEYNRQLKSGAGKPHYPRTFLIIEQYRAANRIPQRLEPSIDRWVEAKMPLFLRDTGYRRGFGVAWTIFRRHLLLNGKPCLLVKAIGNFSFGLLVSFDFVRTALRRLRKLDLFAC